MKQLDYTFFILLICFAGFFIYTKVSDRNGLETANFGGVSVNLPPGYRFKLISVNPKLAEVTLLNDSETLFMIEKSGNKFNGTQDYKDNYVNNGKVFNRCIADGSSSSIFCESILNTQEAVISGHDVFQYKLEYVAEIYDTNDKILKRATSTFETIDILTSGGDLVSILPANLTLPSNVTDYILRNL